MCKAGFDTGNVFYWLFGPKMPDMNLILEMVCCGYLVPEMCKYEFDAVNGDIGYLVPKMCKEEFDMGNGISLVIWSQKCANMNLMLEKVCHWLFGPKNLQRGI